jgi:hypothetical protein
MESDKIVKIDHYTVITRVSLHAQVYIVRNDQDGIIYAIKVFGKLPIDGSLRNNWALLDHINILKFLDEKMDGTVTFQSG